MRVWNPPADVSPLQRTDKSRARALLIKDLTAVAVLLLILAAALKLAG